MARAAKKAAVPTYKSLMTSAGISGLSNEDALANIARLIDSCRMPRHTPGITKALDWCDELEKRGPLPVHQTTLEYYRANAWDHRRPRHKLNPTAAAKWEQIELQNAILSLRRAQISEGFKQSPDMLRCQILTNLGNELSAAGRGIEVAIR